MSDNGKAALQFKSPAIPIIGQPFTIEQMIASVALLGTCHCEGRGYPVLIVGPIAGAVGTCPHCQRTWMLSPHGEINLPLDVSLVRAPGAPGS